MATDRLRNTPKDAPAFQASNPITRRKFLKDAVIIATCTAAAGPFLSACAPAPTTDRVPANPATSPATKPAFAPPPEPARAEFEAVIPQLGKIFDSAYKLRNPKESWINNQTQEINPSLATRVWESLTDQLEQLTSDPKFGNVMKYAKSKNEPGYVDPADPTKLNPYTSDLLRDGNGQVLKRAKWTGYLRVLESHYEKMGYRVENNWLNFPPILAIYRDLQNNPATVNPLGVKTSYLVEEYYIKPENTLLDTLPMVSDYDPYLNKDIARERPAAVTYNYSDREKRAQLADGDPRKTMSRIYYYDSGINLNVKDLEIVGKGEKFADDRLNAKDQDAQTLRQAAQKIIQSLISPNGSTEKLKDTYFSDRLKIHERAHTLNDYGIQSQLEKRSYTDELRSPTPDASRLAMAWFIIQVTRDDVMILTKQGFEPADSNIRGVQSLLQDFLEAVDANKQISARLDVSSVNKLNTNAQRNKFIPNSPFSNEFTSKVFSQIDTFTAEELKIIAGYIIGKNKWLPPGAMLTLANLKDGQIVNLLCSQKPRETQSGTVFQFERTNPAHWVGLLAAFTNPKI